MYHCYTDSRVEENKVNCDMTFRFDVPTIIELFAFRNSKSILGE